MGSDSLSLIRANGGGDLYVYLQVSRGAEWGRNHAIPKDLKPTVFAFAADLPAETRARGDRGRACGHPARIRWGRCDIKSTNLLANVLSKSEAAAEDATEAIFIKDGELHEGSSSAILVVSGNTVHAPVDSHAILPSTSRALVLKLAAAAGLKVAIGQVSVAKLRGADEIWMCNATRAMLPVVLLDGEPVGTGRPGPHFIAVRTRFDQYRRDIESLPPLAGRN